ncbi:MAG: Chaperone protein DnaJ, partial [uncultured Gemmatimonadaceae bacterium]
GPDEGLLRGARRGRESHARGDQEAVPAVGQAVPPRRQQQRPQGGRPLQGDLRGLHGPERRREAPAVRRHAPAGRVRRLRRGPAGRGAPGRRGRAGQRALRGLRRRRDRRLRRHLQLDVRQRRRRPGGGAGRPAARPRAGAVGGEHPHHPLPHRGHRRQGADRARGQRGVRHLPRHRRGARRVGAHLSRVRGARNDLVRPGRLRGEPPLPDVPGARERPHRAVPHLHGERRGAEPQAGAHHRAARRRHRIQDPAQGAGREGDQRRARGRPAHHLRGGARPRVVARRHRRDPDGAAQRRAGDARHPHHRAHARRQAGGAARAARHPLGEAVPHPQPGHPQGRPARRHDRRDRDPGARPAQREAGAGDEGVRRGRRAGVL